MQGSLEVSQRKTAFSLIIKSIHLKLRLDSIRCPDFLMKPTSKIKDLKLIERMK